MLHQLKEKRRSILNLLKTLALLKSLSANFAFLTDYVSSVDVTRIGEIRAFFAPENGSGRIELQQGHKIVTITFEIDVSEGLHD